ncbi:C-X-C chemokine receptor type 5-like [Diretmus argenteus]
MEVTFYTPNSEDQIEWDDLEDLLSGVGSFPGENCSETETDFTCQDEKMGLDLFDAVFQPLIFSLVLLLGMAGNGLMLTVLLKRRGLLRITEIYLLHLALADILYLCTLPFFLAEAVTGWVFGEFLCKLVSLLHRMNFLCGTLLLACIGFDRYLAVVHALHSTESRRPKTVHLICMLLWLVCSGLSAPTCVFASVVEYPGNSSSRLMCVSHLHGIHANNWSLTNGIITHVCFFLPLAVMCYCYTSVVATLCHSHESQEKRGAIRLALLLTVVFCVCWLPYNLTLLLDTMETLGVISYNCSCGAFTRLQVALTITRSLGFSHCCLNPFLYAFVGVRFRNELIHLLSKWGCRCVCLPCIRAQGHRRSSHSDGAATTTSILI